MPTTEATPTGHPRGAMLLWHGVVSCSPTPAHPRVCPSECGFTVSQRGPRDHPLSQAGPWEPPETTLPIPAAPPARQQRSRLSSPVPAGQDHGNARLRGTGVPGREFGTALPDWLRQAAKSHSPFPPHCGRKLPPKKSRRAGRPVCGLSHPGPLALAAQRRGGEMPPIATRGISPPRLRFHNVSSDLSTSCHQTSRPAPT